MENPFKKAVESDENLENKEELNLNLEVEKTGEDTPEEVIEVENQDTQEDIKNEWQEKYETLNNQYIRLAADFDNFRKRQEAERESLL